MSEEEKKVEVPDTNNTTQGITNDTGVSPEGAVDFESAVHEEGAKQAGESKRNHKKLTAIIIAVIIVALAGIGGGYAYWTHHEGNAYHEAVAQAENADKALMKAVDEATATTYKADQLKEPKLLDKLDAAISKAEALKGVPNDAPSEWLAWQLASARKASATDADEANAQAKALNAALKAVRDSRLAKELDGAKDLLKQGIDGASKTFKDTDGKVADNATRDSRYSSNRGYSAPQQSYTAPQQSYTPSSNGGGSHRTFDFSNSGSNGVPCNGPCPVYPPIEH